MKKQILIILTSIFPILILNAQNGSYPSILKIGPFESIIPVYFYIDTKIPFNDSPAPQIHITGYNYSNPNKAVKLTITWYVYNNAFYWTQYKNDLGYYNPSRIRIGTYDDAGTQRIRLEIANDGTYWSSYFVSATDHNGVPQNYAGWSYSAGEMPTGTGNINGVPEHPGIVYSTSGNLGIGRANPNSRLEIFNTSQAGHLLLSANDNYGADLTRIDIDFQVSDRAHTVGRISSFYEESEAGGSGGLRLYSRYQGSLSERLRIASNGNIGIGTASPAYKLDVCGTIRAKEVKVDVQGACPDFVFKND